MLFKNVDIARIKLNKEKYLQSKKGSCNISIHPVLADLREEDRNRVVSLLEELTDILRNNIKDVRDL